MKKCPNCHAENNEKAHFCKECGQKLSEENNQNKVVKTIAIKKPNVTFKNITKKNKILLGIIVLIAFILTGAFYTGKTVYSKEKQVGKFIEVLALNDPDRLAEIIVSPDPNFEVTSDSLKPFTDYIAHNKSYLKDITSSLRDDTLYSSDDLFVNKSGKKFLFFENYELVINPIYFTIETNVEGAIISVNGQEVTVSDYNDSSLEVGPYAPGEFEVEAKTDLNGYQFSTHETESILNENSYEGVYLSLEGVEFDIYSNRDTADVYLDGKIIGQIEDGEGYFGPVVWSEDSELELGIDYPSGVLKSEKTLLGEYYENYGLYFPDEVAYYDVNQSLLTPLLNHITNMSAGDKFDGDPEEMLAGYFTDGRDNEIYIQTLDYTNAFSANPDKEELFWNIDTLDVIQTDLNLYEVTILVDLITYYSSDSEIKDLEESYEYKITIETYDKGDTYNTLGFKVKEVTNKIDMLAV